MAECECQIEAAGMKTPLRMADNDSKAKPGRGLSAHRVCNNDVTPRPRPTLCEIKCISNVTIASR